jgi:hypothetical protein
LKNVRNALCAEGTVEVQMQNNIAVTDKTFQDDKWPQHCKDIRAFKWICGGEIKCKPMKYKVAGGKCRITCPSSVSSLLRLL